MSERRRYTKEPAIWLHIKKDDMPVLRQVMKERNIRTSRKSFFDDDYNDLSEDGRVYLLIINNRLVDKTKYHYSRIIYIYEIDELVDYLNTKDITDRIEIVDGHDFCDYFWLRPAIIEETGEVDDIYGVKIFHSHLLRDEISIQEDIADSCLKYWFYKYYDKNYDYNLRRPESLFENNNNFEWYLTENYYSYSTMEKMCEEILEVADLLETDYNNQSLDEIKKSFFVPYKISKDERQDDDYIKTHAYLFIDFYRRFVSKIRKIMNRNKDTDVFTITGP